MLGLSETAETIQSLCVNVNIPGYGSGIVEMLMENYVHSKNNGWKLSLNWVIIKSWSKISQIVSLSQNILCPLLGLVLFM